MKTGAMKTGAKLGRRDVLRALGAGAGVAAAGSGLVTSADAAESAGSAEQRKSVYRETDHIKAYYRVNRYPAKR